MTSVAGSGLRPVRTWPPLRELAPHPTRSRSTTTTEAPRFASYSHPESFTPHPYRPGVLRVEARVPIETIRGLADLGHKIDPWKAWQWQAGGVCAITSDPETGLLCGGTDPRRENYAVGW